MALTNPAKSLYYNAEQYYKLKEEQTNNPPKTGLLGKNNSNFMSTKISSNNGEKSPAQRAADYFITLRRKRIALEAPHVGVKKEYEKIKAMKDAMTEKAAYYDTDNSRLRRRNEKAKSRMLDSFRS
tara:strand:+ start:1939 stop:2316 length:378 start_codon:yes stop_codon:yes gene_type:complete